VAVIEVDTDAELEAGCARCGVPLSKPGQRFCSMACEGASHTGSGHPKASGVGDPVVPVPAGEPAPAVRVCELPGCGEPVSAGHGAKFCSERHRRKAYDLRNGDGRARAEVAPRPKVAVPGAFEALAALPGLLPPGWRAEVTASSVTVSWSV
jgi:hypothetical protein